MTTFGVLPVKKLCDCKQRLSDTLTQAERTALMEEMFVDAVIAAVNCDSLAGTIVVSDDAKVRELALRSGAEAIPEGELGSHSAAALVGIRASVTRGATSVALLAGDCPLIDSEAIELLLANIDPTDKSVVIAADRHGTGTNALVITPPDAIKPAFGNGSLAEHQRRAESVGANVKVVRLIEFEYDVDTADDLAQIERLSASATR